MTMNKSETKMFTKTDIVNRLYNEQPLNQWGERDISRRRVIAIVDDVFDWIKSGVKKEGRLRIAGLGVFRLHQMDERKGRNPKTGEAMMLPARLQPKFRASEGWVKEMNAGV